MKRLLIASVATCLGVVFATGASAQSLSAKMRVKDVQSARTVSPQSVGDSYKGIYRVAGVLEGGATGNPSSTTFFCTNYSATTEKIYLQLKDFNGAIKASVESNIIPGKTVTATTGVVLSVFIDFILLGSGVSILGGSAVILSTTTNMHCSALVMDRRSTAMNGAALHMVRFNPIGGTSE